MPQQHVSVVLILNVLEGFFFFVHNAWSISLWFLIQCHNHSITTPLDSLSNVTTILSQCHLISYPWSDLFCHNTSWFLIQCHNHSVTPSLDFIIISIVTTILSQHLVIPHPLSQPFCHNTSWFLVHDHIYFITTHLASLSSVTTRPLEPLSIITTVPSPPHNLHSLPMECL